MRRVVGAGLAVAAIAAALAIGFAHRGRKHDGARAGDGTRTAPAAVGKRRVAPKTIAAPGWFSQPGAPLRRVAGRVTYHGEPVAGARVSLWSQLVSSRLVEQPVAQTDDAGRFDLGEQPAGEWAVAAESGRRMATLWLKLTDPTARPAADRLELALRDCDASVYGTVEDASGGPVAGATLEIYSSGLLTTATDEQGRYDICIPRGDASLRVDAAEYASSQASVTTWGRARQDFTLVPGMSIRGQVVRREDGTPVAGARILAAPLDATGPLVDRVSGSATSSDDGTFVVAGLRAGRYQLDVRAEGLTPTGPVDVTLGMQGEQEPVVCRMDTASTLTGVVLEGDRPIAGARIWLSGPGAGPLNRAYSQTDGGFAIDHLRPGTFKVYVNGYELLEPRELTVDASTPPHVIIRVASNATIRGRVVYLGKPVVDGTVEARSGPKKLSLSDDNMIQGKSRTFAQDAIQTDGTFELRGLPPGTYDLYATSPDAGAFTRGKPVTVSKGEVIEGIVVELDLAASIAGIVVDERGAPVAGATVRLSLTRGTDSGMASTGDDGAFIVRGLAGGGDYAPTIKTPDGNTTYQPVGSGKALLVTLPDGASQVTGLRYEVQRPTLAIAGRVIRVGGAPVADAMVTAARQRAYSEWAYSGVRSSAHANTAVDGTFTLNDLVAGDYRVRAEAGSLAVETRVTAGMSDVLLTLPDAGALEGTLVGFQADVRVVVSGGSVAWRRDNVRPVEGRFRVGDLEPGKYVVRAWDATGTADVEIDVAAGQLAQVTLESRGLARFDGRLIDLRTGRPIEGWTCAPGGDIDAPRVTTAADGRFSLSIAAGANVRVSCESANWTENPAARVEVVAARGERVERVLIGLVRVNRDRPGKAGVGMLTPDLRIDSQYGGAAEAAGLKQHDQIVSVDGVTVTDVPYWIVLAFIDDHAPGETVAITVERDGERMEIRVRMD